MWKKRYKIVLSILDQVLKYEDYAACGMDEAYFSPVPQGRMYAVNGGK